jgi:hypothetical protein
VALGFTGYAMELQYFTLNLHISRNIPPKCTLTNTKACALMWQLFDTTHWLGVL